MSTKLRSVYDAGTMHTKFDVHLKCLIALAVVVSIISIFYPVVNSDSVIYATIAKNIALHNDWVNLIYMGQDWLDKPHFPFWITALSFKLFGVNNTAYVAPGLLFHLIGAYFTYKIANFLYNKRVALLSCLIYLTLLRLLIGMGDLRAEAYLLGEIIPACYYWLCYDKTPKLRYLLLGAIFSALALMTKGLFILVVIGSGLICKWLYEKKWRNFVAIKWYIAIALTFVFIAPEIIALYLQFDNHPEKIVFGRTHVSGVKFFFWESQFGRFFDFNPIEKKHGHFFYFIPVFLWACLPWTLVFIAAIANGVKNFKHQVIEKNAQLIYLSAPFFIQFILFSLASYQLDHYLDIILPFAAIICAYYLIEQLRSDKRHWIFYLQIGVASIVTLLGFLLGCIAVIKSHYSLLFITPILLLGYVYILRSEKLGVKAILFSAISILITFIFLMVLNRTMYVNYDVGYKLGNTLKQEKMATVYIYKTYIPSFTFHSPMPYVVINDLTQVKATGDTLFYVVTTASQWGEVVKKFPQAQLVKQENGLATNLFSKRLFNKSGYTRHVDLIRVLQ